MIMVATTIVDTSERKTAFGQQARHVKMMIDKQPMAGACDTSKQRIETDGWYIDNPPSIANRPSPTEQTPPSPDGCTDQIQATSNGDPKVLGFPIAYTTTLTGDDGKPVVVDDGSHRIRGDDARSGAVRDSGGFQRGHEHPRSVEGAERRERSEAGGGQRRASCGAGAENRQGSCASACLSSPTRPRRPWTRVRCASA